MNEAYSKMEKTFLELRNLIATNQEKTEIAILKLDNKITSLDYKFTAEIEKSKNIIILWIGGILIGLLVSIVLAVFKFH